MKGQLLEILHAKRIDKLKKRLKPRLIRGTRTNLGG